MFSQEQGEKSVEIARNTLENFLRDGEEPDLDEELSDQMEEERGVFVTLEKNGDLRGCIGRPMPRQPFIEGLVNSAINAATRDPRFPEVSSEELEDITIEVSMLTVPEEVEVEDPKRYPEKIEVGRDGLIVKYGGSEGLLLPQVPVDNNWESEEFLSQTCVKAGLSSDAWIKEDISLEKFSAQVFKEEEPSGEVVEEELSA